MGAVESMFGDVFFFVVVYSVSLLFFVINQSIIPRCLLYQGFSLGLPH